MKIELAALLAQRWSGETTEGGPDSGARPEGGPADDPASMHAWESRERRIRQLQELVRSAVVHQPPDDGVAEPGMVLTVHYQGIEDVTDTFLMAERKGADYDYGDLEICSPRSPLGRALVGAKQGEERQYRVPDGERMTVTLVKAVPYRSSPMTPSTRRAAHAAASFRARGEPDHRRASQPDRPEAGGGEATESLLDHGRTPGLIPDAASVPATTSDLVDEWGWQSFPASDPPQNW